MEIPMEILNAVNDYLVPLSMVGSLVLFGIGLIRKFLLEKKAGKMLIIGMLLFFGSLLLWFVANLFAGSLGPADTLPEDFAVPNIN